MNAKTIFTFFGGVVTGLVLGVWLFSGPSTQVSQAPQPVAQNQPQVDKIKLQQNINQLEGLLKNDPENYQAWKKLGDSYFDVEQPAKSVEAYRKALAIDDGDPNVWTDMGVMYRKMGDPAKAIESFDKAIERGPTHTVSRLNKGVVYIYDMNDVEKGIAAWEDFLQVQPSGPQADNIRAELQQLKLRQGIQEPGGELPEGHPTLDSQEAAPGSGGTDPAGYFPKPEQP
jgi:cytochrome c-type biogenesis protein CcmH/NrfG